MIMNFLTSFTPTLPTLFGFAKRKIGFYRLPFFALSALLFAIYYKDLSMMKKMFFNISQKKIFRSIVKFVSVNVMNKLRWKKLSTKFLLHNKSMDMKMFSIDLNSKITFWRNTTYFSKWGNRIAIMPKCIAIMAITISFSKHFLSTIFNFTNFHTNTVHHGMNLNKEYCIG